MQEITTEEAIDVIAQKWRTRGFPHYRLSKEQQLKEFHNLSKYDRSNLITNNVIKQTLHAMGLIWHYFPHHWEIKTGNMLTPVDVWNDDEKFRKAIKSRLKWGGYQIINDEPDLTEAYLRKALRTYSGVQRVSNFRPTAAAAIYDHYAGDGVVWDMSSGFGGRLMGAIVSDRVKHYIGTDPASQTFDGLTQMKQDWGTAKTIELHKQGSETFIPSESVDLCFTSPPYFNTEKYTQEETQSYKKFPNATSWNEGFLRKTIENCKSALKPHGSLLLNVANVKTHLTLEADTVRIAEEEGFELKETLQLSLSSISKGGFKYEPVFVFNLR